jgi:hypothetical protein
MKRFDASQQDSSAANSSSSAPERRRERLIGYSDVLMECAKR